MTTLRDIFSWPITQLFGPTHTGVDLGLPLGTLIGAEGTGVVETIFTDRIGGNQVKVKYASGAEGWFAHLAAIFVMPGQSVDPSTVLGASGASGTVTGPHLHFEERNAAGQLIDPLSAVGQSLITGAVVPGGAGPASCQPGSKLINGVCYTAGGYGPAEKFMPTIPVPGSGTPIVDVPKAALEALSGAQRAIAGLLIGGAVVAIVAIVGVSGVKKTLD